jgi:UDP-N-acetylmuramoyl-tripeptide--D-alanyl-D-alanine ligase
MRPWTAARIARAAGASVISGADESSGPEGVTIDSRSVEPGSLFVGLPGERLDGGRFATAALRAGAWGVLTAPEHAVPAETGVVLAAEDPLRALQRLATAWRRHLGAAVIAVTGSTGKTSTKDLLLALLAPHRRTVASRANFNTEIGLPLEILAAPDDTEVLVLEMGMRGAGQIAELTRVAQPDVGLIVSVGPVHLELLGTIENIAAAKSELIAGLAPGSWAVVPAGEALLTPHLRGDVRTVTFGDRGDVHVVAQDERSMTIDAAGEPVELEVPFTQSYLRLDLLAAVAGARAVGVTPGGRVQLALTPGRGQRSSLPGGVILIDGCYNANPMSMQAALDDLGSTATGAGGRRIAVLGDMLELGPDERQFHVDLSEHVTAAGVDVLVTVGPLAGAAIERFDGESHVVGDAAEAATLVPGLLTAGDVVLVKASRGVGLELVCRALRATGAQ